MLKPSHINVGYTASLVYLFFYPYLTPLYVLVPLIAILPDADHGESSVNKKGLYLPGKHRGWAHSLFGITLLAIIVYLFFASYLFFFGKKIDFAFIFQDISRLAIFVLACYILYYIGQKALGKVISFWICFIAFFVGFFYLLKFHFISYSLGFIFFILLSHLIADFITKQGIPFFRPDKKNFKNFITIKTGGELEKIITVLLAFLNAGLFIWLIKTNNITVQFGKSGILLLLLSTLLVLYFFSKDLKFKYLQKSVYLLIFIGITILVISFFALMIKNIYFSIGIVVLGLFFLIYFLKDNLRLIINGLNLFILLLFWFLYFYKG